MTDLYKYHNKYPFKLFIKLGYALFNRCFFLYRWLYFAYKNYNDREKIKFLRENIKPGMTVLDIGANVGFYTTLLSKLVGDEGLVYVFEPDRQNYEYLKSNTKRLKNICLNNSAVSEKTGKIRLFRSPELNTRHQTFDSGEKRDHTEIDCVAIDDYFKNGEKINFIKIDIEGYEYYALSGMKKTIERSDKVTLLGEFWPYGIKRSGVDPASYLTRLKDMGFEIKFFDLEYDDIHKLKENNRFSIASFYCTKRFI